MEDLFILLGHLLVTIAKLLRPGGVRIVAAENAVLKQQLLVVNLWVANYNFSPENRPLGRRAAELIFINFRGRPIVAGYTNSQSRRD